jgi:secreted trypsin-like serine protease
MAFVLDQLEPGKFGLCSGTVVAPNLILTAGHCAVDIETGEIHPASGYAVVTGNVNWTSSPRQVIGVSQVLVFPNYQIGGTLQGWGDAALLVLSAPTSAPSIPLATSANAERLQAGTGSLIAGWGETVYEQEAPQTELQWAKTVVQSRGYCEANAPGFHPLGQICTVNPPSFATGICHGDSGGPLIAAGPGGNGVVEIGIASSGYGQCSTTQPNVFTRSDLIATWVNERIAALNPPPAPKRAAPASSIPKAPVLPTLSRGKASLYARQGLAEGLGSRFSRRRQYRATCEEVNSSKQRCGVQWTSGPNDYYGYITIYYAFSEGRLVWGDRYTIHWVNDYCYFDSGHPRRCTIHTARK